MLFFSHVVIANNLETYLQPSNLEEYYLGAIAPDIRYYARLPRETTHLTMDKVADFESRYPSLQSFLLGYKTHIAAENCMDALRMDDRIKSQFPISLIKNSLPNQFVSVLIEYFYLETKSLRVRCATSINPILLSMGITQQVLSDVTLEVNTFFQNPTFRAAITGITKLGLAGGSSIQKYLRVANQINENRIAKFLLFTVTRKHIKYFDAHAPRLILQAIKS